jgi:hypothetical protein
VLCTRSWIALSYRSAPDTHSCSLQVALPALSLLPSDVFPTQARCNTTTLNMSSSTKFTGNAAGWAGPDIYAAASSADAPLHLAAELPVPQKQWVSGPVAEVVVQGTGLEAYVSSDDVYLDLTVHVLDAWKQPVTGSASAVCGVATVKIDAVERVACIPLLFLSRSITLVESAACRPASASRARLLTCEAHPTVRARPVASCGAGRLHCYSSASS